MRMELNWRLLCKRGMDNRIDLITRQDIDAFADGEMDGVRLDAVLRRIGDDDHLLVYALKTVQMNAELVALKWRLYADAELKEAVRTALSGGSAMLSDKNPPPKTCRGIAPAS